VKKIGSAPPRRVRSTCPRASARSRAFISNTREIAPVYPVRRLGGTLTNW
jgi:hypothetical protein